MKKKEYEECLKKEKERETYLHKQIEENMKKSSFEEESINELIVTTLTKLTCKDIDGEDYILFEDIFHRYIHDLEILYNIKKYL